jgi:hypothetical protein
LVTWIRYVFVPAGPAKAPKLYVAVDVLAKDAEVRRPESNQPVVGNVVW